MTAPIVGTTKLENLKEIIGGLFEYSCSFERLTRITSDTAAVDIKLTEDEIKYLEEAYKPQKVSGHQ